MTKEEAAQWIEDCVTRDGGLLCGETRCCLRVGWTGKDDEIYLSGIFTLTQLQAIVQHLQRG